MDLITEYCINTYGQDLSEDDISEAFDLFVKKWNSIRSPYFTFELYKSDRYEQVQTWIDAMKELAAELGYE